MDYDNPQFIAAVKKTSLTTTNEIQEKVTLSLHDDLARIAEHLKNLEDTISAERQADKETKHTNPSVAITDLRTNVPISVQDKTKKTIPERGWAVFKGFLETLGILAVIFYTFLAFRQWREMIAARHQNQISINAANRSADAAQSAANTAKEALHISERAYIAIGVPQLNYENRSLTMAVTNTGHIPASKLKTTIHEATVIRTPGPITPPYPNFPTEEMHWTEDIADTCCSGGNMELRVRVPSLDKTRIESRQQKIFIVGQVIYNDGFPDTDNQITPFCFSTDVRVIPSSVIWAPCDWKTELAISKRLDQYPSRKYYFRY